MPELPEVETVRRGLADLLPGQAVVRATVFDSPKSFPNSPTDVQQFLYGAHVTAVRRRAKVLMIDLDTRYSLVIHLKMTGQLIFRGANSFAGGHPNDSLIGELPDRSTRVQIDFTDGSRLFFNDQRKFGWMKLMPTDEIGNLPFMQKVGPEPLDKKTEAGDFIKRIRRRQNSMIKPALVLADGDSKLVASDFSANPYVLRKLTSSAKGVDKKKLKRINDALLRADLQMKTTSVNPWLLVEAALVGIGK
jgi:formamidopyrimidine-DNA glycosylase